MRFSTIALSSILLLALSAIPLPAQRRSIAPYVAFVARDTIAWYDVAPVFLQATAGPNEATVEARMGTSPMTLSLVDAEWRLFSLTSTTPPPVGITPVVVSSTYGGMRKEWSVMIHSEHPSLRFPLREWPGSTATMLAWYDPSTDWANTRIPRFHYITEVEIDGQMKMQRRGTRFGADGRAHRGVSIPNGTRSVVTRVWWTPNGTADRSRWVLLLSTSAADKPVVAKPEVIVTPPIER